jgi:hypothetical protein
MLTNQEDVGAFPGQSHADGLPDASGASAKILRLGISFSESERTQ